MSEWLHPAWPCLAGAAFVLVGPDRLRAPVTLAAPAVAVALAWILPEGQTSPVGLMGLELVVLRVDALARAFALIFALIAVLGALYALPAGRPRLLAAALTAAGAATGIALAGDWVTLYVWWETLALASFVLVLDGRTGRAAAAAFRYLLVHALGGSLLLAGIVWRRAVHGSGLVEPLGLDGPGLLVLAAFAINAAVPPLHAWLTDAYPESSPPGTVFLSAFATKAAVYALARVFPGEPVLLWAGVVMSLYGVVLATLENDIRRLLGYHIVSQVGYMVAGVGLGTPLALSGATAHAFSHILYKGLLLMGAGAVVHATGRRKLTELGGLGPAMPATLVLYMIGAFSIAGAPLLNGFVSKSIIVAAAEIEHRTGVVWLLQLAAVGTFLSTGLKLPYFAFAGPDRGLVPVTVPLTMLAAMTLTAALCALSGIRPDLLYALLPFPVSWEPYTASHVMEALQLLAGTAVGFAWLRPHLAAKPAIIRDTDRLYRAAGRWIGGRLAPAVARAAEGLEAGAAALATARLGARREWMASPIGYAALIAVIALGLGLSLVVVCGP